MPVHAVKGCHANRTTTRVSARQSKWNAREEQLLQQVRAANVCRCSSAYRVTAVLPTVSPPHAGAEPSAYTQKTCRYVQRYCCGVAIVTERPQKSVVGTLIKLANLVGAQRGNVQFSCRATHCPDSLSKWPLILNTWHASQGKRHACRYYSQTKPNKA